MTDIRHTRTQSSANTIPDMQGDRRSGDERRVVQWEHFCPHCQMFLTDAEVRGSSFGDIHDWCNEPVLEFDDGSMPYTTRATKDRRGL